jgi:cyclopropane fatty-acyl-phospholipid synthase-like methyltransferase
MDKWRESWGNLTPVGRRYGQLLYRRAVGELPEMESSKAIAKRVARELIHGDKLLDVGCGAGHYLKSLRNIVPYLFKYVGVDASADYLVDGMQVVGAIIQPWAWLQIRLEGA